MCMRERRTTAVVGAGLTGYSAGDVAQRATNYSSLSPQGKRAVQADAVLTAVGAVATGAQGVRASGGAAKVRTPNTATGEGYGVNDPAVRLGGKWSPKDIEDGLMGRSPEGLGSPDLHHAHQMPGSGIHEVAPGQHQGNRALHPNKYNQGVTPQMRNNDRRLHWWYRAREQGADKMYPDRIYDK